MNNAAQFEQRKAEIIAEIAKSKDSYKQLEAQLKQTNEGWLQYYEEAIDELKQNFKEVDRDALKTWLEKSENEKRELEAEIKQVTQEVDQLDLEINKTEPERSDEELARLKQLTEEKLVHFKTLMNKKQTLYAEMLNNARLLMDIND